MSEDPDPSDDHTAVKPVLGKRIPREEIGHYLVVVDDRDADRRIELGAESLGIGRDPSRHIVFNDVSVSRLHAEIGLSSGQVLVTDLGSTNGTFINGRRIHARARMMDGDLLHVGVKRVRYERRSRREIREADALDRDLQKATSYVLSLFPAPILDGPIRTDWLFRPSARLGGDGFGYEWLEPDTFMMYLIDVSGHGLGAAMHTVSVLNVLWQRALPFTDFADPAQVLSALNAMFQMDSHDGMYFTMWYGVYNRQSRLLRYASAGHHPVYGVSAERMLTPLRTPGVMIGAQPDSRCTPRRNSSTRYSRTPRCATSFQCARAPEPPRPTDLDRAQVGGLGLVLVRKASTRIDYEWTAEGRNRLTVVVSAKD